MSIKTRILPPLAALALCASISLIIAGQMYDRSLQNDPTRLNLPSHFALKDESWSKPNRLAMFVTSEDQILVYAEIGATRDGHSIDYDLVNGLKLLGGDIATAGNTRDMIVSVTNSHHQTIAAYDRITDSKGVSVWTIWDDLGHTVATAADSPDELIFKAPDGTTLATISRDQTRATWTGNIKTHGKVPDAIYALIAGYRMSLELNH